MPVYPGADLLIRDNLETIAAGGKASHQVIGYFTDAQFEAINDERAKNSLPPIESKDIVYVGRHHYKRRGLDDGYSIDDMVAQVISALDAGAAPQVSPKMTTTRNPIARADPYGNSVYDEAVFECTARKPHAELFSVIPKGDRNKPPR